jgi:hypothetical protein
MDRETDVVPLRHAALSDAGVSYYADAEGNLYAKSVVPARRCVPSDARWFSGMRREIRPYSVALSRISRPHTATATP